MRDVDYNAFAALLDDVAALLPRAGGQPLNGPAKAMYFRALMAHELADVRGALDAHVRDPQRGRFFPTPADVIAQLHGPDDGRPGPEEAWAIALSAQDERTTVVWTQDMAMAWSVARPVFAIGDEIGARMAFRESYTRVIGEARVARLPVAWTVSLGFDTEGRTEPILAAVALGRLPRDTLLSLPAPASDAALRLVGGIADKARESLRQIADELRGRSDEVCIDTTERDALNERKAAIDAKVKDYLRDDV